jgi:hypothetical protein
MTRAQRLERELDSAQQICNATTVAVGGLYLATHSVAVTALGTVTAAALCGWSMWLACRNRLALPDRTEPSCTDDEYGAIPTRALSMRRISADTSLT